MTCYDNDFAFYPGLSGIGCDFLESGDVFERSLVTDWVHKLLGESCESSFGRTTHDC
jgi:hypothetical protein